MVDPNKKVRPFDDVADPDNMGFIPQMLKELSKTKPAPSDNSMSSGSGHYESDALKEDLSDDSDLQKIKILTKEK